MEYGKIVGTYFAILGFLILFSIPVYMLLRIPTYGALFWAALFVWMGMELRAGRKKYRIVAIVICWIVISLIFVENIMIFFIGVPQNVYFTILWATKDSHPFSVLSASLVGILMYALPLAILLHPATRQAFRHEASDSSRNKKAQLADESSRS